MGCGSSSAVGPAGPRTYTVKIDAGMGVKSLKQSADGKKIIFIFGGPSTCSGLLIQNLINEYGWCLLSSEELVLQSIRSKSNDEIETKELIKEYAKQSKNMDWILQLISEAMAKNPNAPVYLVDVLPNHKALMKEDDVVDAALAKFEEQNGRVLFGINLYYPQDALEASMLKDKKEDKKKKEGEETQASDEADKGKMLRRYLAYQTAARPFVNYFSNLQRMVTVDVSRAPPKVVWEHVRDYLNSLEFNHEDKMNTVIIFAFAGLMMENVDLSTLGLEVVKLIDLISEEAKTDSETAKVIKEAQGNTKPVPVEWLLRLVKHKMDVSKQAQGFVVDFAGVNFDLSNVQLPKHTIIFHEQKTRLSDRFIYKYHNASASAIEFQSCLTTQNQVVLFPQSVPFVNCMKVANLMQQLPKTL
eukprot:Colp12_sorted_trinity150504_noHs@13313